MNDWLQASFKLLCAKTDETAAVVALAAILDVDGTLVDTNYQHAIAWYRAFRQHDKVLPIWLIHRHIGMGGDQLVAALAGDDWDEEHGDDVRTAEKALYMALIEEVEPLQGARGLIEDLKDRRPQRRPGELGEGERGRPLPRPARRARACGRLDHLGRRRRDEARARPRQGRRSRRRAEATP